MARTRGQSAQPAPSPANGLAGFDESSAAIVTLNVCVTGALIPLPAVTVIVTVPVTPFGALSCRTPFCVSVKSEAEVIVRGVCR